MDSSGEKTHHQQPIGTYLVEDQENLHEIDRVRIQDQMITAGIGGALPEQPDPAGLQRVLDVGCGAGDWLINVAREYPTISKLVGVDVNRNMIEYAREQARIENFSDRVEFAVMDATRMIEFPQKYFSLANMRLASSFLRTWEWPKILSELQRVTRPGGGVRVTETNIAQTSSPAHEQLNLLIMDALYNSGHLFELDKNSMNNQLPGLLHQHGVVNVQTRTYPIEFRPGTDSGTGQAFYNDARHAYRTFKPFIQKWSRLPDDYDQLYQQMLNELKEPDALVVWTFLTAWGDVPSKIESPSMTERH